MAKLPTSFTKLNLEGFEIPQRDYSRVDMEMVNVACAALQKNGIGIVVRSLSAALKEIYGISCGAQNLCNYLNEWRKTNLAQIKQGKGEKDIVSAILEATDDGLLEEAEIPEEYLLATKQMALAAYKLAYQKADTAISGSRLKELAQENEVLRQQTQDYPQMKFQLEFYKSEYNRQQNELREAYMNLNKQQLADSEQFRHQLDALNQERNDLAIKLAVAEKHLAEVADLEAKERERTGEISRLNGQLEAREREISSQHDQIQQLQAQIGEKQVLESQLEGLRTQLKEANETITRLQAQQQSVSALEVDFVDVDELREEIELLNRDISVKEYALIESKERIKELESELEAHKAFA